MPDKIPDKNPSLVRRLKLVGLAAVFIAGLVFATGVTTRLDASKRTAAFASEQSIQTVTVVKPSRSSASGTLKLPGKLKAFYSAPIYARVPGYVHAWYKDIGAPVRKGDVLALIDTPELDEQIQQAKADLANAIAAQKLSQSTAERWTSLLALDAVSKQEADNKTGDLAAKTALVTAARANVDRLTALKSFARITAPFDGIVTDRSVDIGTLVNAGAQTSGLALFTVSDLRRLRVYVSVPQNYSAEIRPGLRATMSVPEYPAKTFVASLDSTSNAISEQSDTLLVELLADNAGGELKPGDFVQVAFQLAMSRGRLRLPASALMFRREGLEVATVLPSKHILMKQITLARDLGTSVEISAGLNPQDRVVDNPPDSIQNGDPVRLASSNEH